MIKVVLLSASYFGQADLALQRDDRAEAIRWLGLFSLRCLTIRFCSSCSWPW